MLSRRLLIFYLFILCVDIFGQRDSRNVLDLQKGRSDKEYPVRNSVEVLTDVNDISQQKDHIKGTKQLVSSGQSTSKQLSTTDECKDDIQKYCSKGSQQPLTNIKVLECVDELDNAVNLINAECQDVIYDFKLKMTQDPRFDDAAMKQCSKDHKIFDDCAQHTDERGSGRLVTCLYETLANITEPSCRYYINQLQAVVFSDWRLSEYFVDACRADIQKLECGRLDDNNHKLQHEQGAVVSCLSEKYAELTQSCRKEILRLAEMQSDDYHLDRVLYYACRDDRERLCAQVASRNGRVYRCLYEQKFNLMMSAACRKEVHRRQSLVVANVKTDVPLVRACAKEMIEHRCSIDPDDIDKRSSLVKLLLCLGERSKKGYYIEDECRREMLIHRRMLMSDYTLSPEIVFECKTEMVRFCPSLMQQGASETIDSRGGRMIHCLLNAARKEELSKQCLFVVKSLIRAVDPGSDVRADPLLETACRPVIDTLCPRIKPGDSNIIMCLLDNLKNSRMTEECEDRLMEVAYFMARDWRLTPKLMHTCRVDLETFCNLPKDWKMSDDMIDVQVGMYLGCLYQNRQQLERDCRTELKRLMRIRTQTMGLMPEVEETCIVDLATCKNRDAKGEEMKCLQQKYKKLEDQCKEAVKIFTEMTMADPTLDFLLMKACEPMIQSYCPNIDNGKENNLIRCLIRYKNELKMDFRCKTSIEHYQITSMKDEAFVSAPFRSKCGQEVQQHCHGRKTKSSVVQCLANLMLLDVLKKQNEITSECRDELKFELLQRSENIEFDPVLAKACSQDIKNFCGDRTPGNAEIIDCLKDNRNKVSLNCYKKLKEREKLDVIAPENDYSLMSKCEAVIQKSCANERHQNILLCLQRNINFNIMPNTCRRILYHRLMILNSDAKFNKALIQNCQEDINKYCHDEVVVNYEDDKDTVDDDDNYPNNDRVYDNNNDLTDRDMGGRVIQCLRSKYVDTKVTLNAQCITELIDVIQMSKLDLKLDVRLYETCRQYLIYQCTSMEQEECLKLLYQKGEISYDTCKEQIQRIIKEEQKYLNADQALYSVCQMDIIKYCYPIPRGSEKQLQCLLSMKTLLTPSCENILTQRQNLWQSMPDGSNFISADYTVQKIAPSAINFPTMIYFVLLFIAILMFMGGYVYRTYTEHGRTIQYDPILVDKC